MSVRSVLVGGGPSPAVPRSLSLAEATELFGDAVRGRAVPRLAEALRSGTLVVPEVVEARVAAADAEIQLVSLVLERTANRVIDLLEGAGSEPVVLKGLATAHLDHVEPRLRQTSDVDLLVGPDELDLAEEILTRADFTPLGRSGSGSATKSTTLRSPEGVEVDVHRLPTKLPYGRWVRSSPVRFETVCVSTRPWRVLPAADRFVHAVVHYVLSGGAYRRTSSAADALALWPDEADQEAWVEAIERWRAPAVVAVFTTLMHDDFGLALPPIPGCTVDRAGWFERELVTDGRPGVIAHHLAPLTSLPAREVVGQLVRHTFPGRSYVERSPHPSWSRRLAYAAGTTIRSLRR